MGLNMNAGLEENPAESADKYIDEDEKNKYLRNPQLGLELCANLVSKGKPNSEEILNDINKNIAAFLDISEQDDNTTGGVVYKKLQEIKEDLNSIISFPQLENRYTVAVGGGFSSGKSRFLNSVLGLEELLPTDTDPTTSISTYITKGNDEQYYALNNFNNRIAIDAEAIQAISHEFKSKYSVTFSHILKLITIEQTNLKHPNLIFLDTPGYSKPDANSADKNNQIDENIAREHLRSADYLIWLVDCQTPLKGEDITFIKTLELDKPILVVLNKADKKQPEDVAKQVEVTKTNLIKKNIPFVDVIGYSAAENKEFSKTANVLKEFLNQLSEGKSGTKILRRTQRLFSEYLSYYNSQIEEFRGTRKIINDIILSDELSGKIADEITTLGTRYKKKIDALQKSQKSVESISKRIVQLVSDLLQDNNIDISEDFIDCNFDSPKNSKSKKELFRFNGSIQIKDKSGLTQFKDLKSIPAKIYNVSSMGVFIKINNLECDLCVSKGEIKKIAGDDFISKIKKDDIVTVQIENDKKCIVIING